MALYRHISKARSRIKFLGSPNTDFLIPVFHSPWSPWSFGRQKWQHVVNNTSYESSSLTIGYGVPQGSILGPILFVIYINDLPQSLLKSQIGMYVDDTVIYFSDPCPDVIKQVLQNDLTNVEKWLVSNRLILNQRKTKWMLFGTRRKLEHCPDYKIELHVKNIDRVSSFC